MVRPRVFFDIQQGTEPLGRIIIELFNDHTPKTCENFRLLCTNATPPITLPNGRVVPLHYQGCAFHRIIPEFMIQGGDITMGTGTGGASTFEGGKAFEDEALGWREIDKEGLVCMANRGAGTNTSQFFITLTDCSFLTQKHTLFGHVVAGMDVVKRMAEVAVDEKDKPTEDVIIVNSGELQFRKKEKTEQPPKAKEPLRIREHRNRSLSRSPSPPPREHGRKPRRDGDGERRHRHHRRRSHSRSRSRPRQMSAEEPGRRSRSPGAASIKSPEDTAKPIHSPSPPPRRHRYRHHSRSRSRSPRRHSPPPRHRRHYRSRSRSPRRSRHDRHRDREMLYSRDDPDAEERIRREEREREMVRTDEAPAPQVTFKGRGSMKYRERKQWGGGGEYGRLN